MKYIKSPKIILFLTVIVVSLFITINIFPKEKILGASDQKILASPTPILKSLRPTPGLPTPTSTPAPKLSKAKYKIALFGDSMIDTMGDMKYLNDALVKKYPETGFIIYNYGIGSQNAEEGLARFYSKFNYMERSYEPISQIKADVIILGSFAYNPFATHDKAKHLRALKELAIRASKVSDQTYLLAEIAPLKEGFGIGQHGPNWPQDIAFKHTLKIIDQLENVFVIGKTLNLPVIDVYTRTIDKEKWGRKIYVNGDDGLHPSYDGQMFTASVIAKLVELK